VTKVCYFLARQNVNDFYKTTLVFNSQFWDASNGFFIYGLSSEYSLFKAF